MDHTASAPLVGAIEAGGTKFVCAVGRGPGAGLLAREQFATGDDPARLLAQVAAWLRVQAERHGPLAALGVVAVNHELPPFNNPKLLTAIRHALDQDEYMAAVLGDFAKEYGRKAGVFVTGSP